MLVRSHHGFTLSRYFFRCTNPADFNKRIVVPTTKPGHSPKAKLCFFRGCMELRCTAELQVEGVCQVQQVLFLCFSMIGLARPPRAQEPNAWQSCSVSVVPCPFVRVQPSVTLFLATVSLDQCDRARQQDWRVFLSPKGDFFENQGVAEKLRTLSTQESDVTPFNPVAVWLVWHVLGV